MINHSKAQTRPKSARGSWTNTRLLECPRRLQYLLDELCNCNHNSRSNNTINIYYMFLDKQGICYNFWLPLTWDSKLHILLDPSTRLVEEQHKNVHGVQGI